MHTDKKVLIVEDDQTLREILATKLKTQGYVTFQEENGKDSVQKILAIKPDLILLDIDMPEKNGYEVLEEIHKNQMCKDIPVIIISNSGQPVEIERVLALGAKDYIIKANFSPNEILDKMSKYLPQKVVSSPEATKKKNADIKILVVEDDEFLGELAMMRLKKEGYNISFVADGMQALETIEKEIPDLMLLDIVMPKMDGFEVLKKIKADSRYAKIIVIIFSNLSQEHDIEEAKRLGADEFLIKSNMTLKEAVEKINNVLKEKGLV
jgi:CheY-like chemotaxis protein